MRLEHLTLSLAGAAAHGAASSAVGAASLAKLRPDAFEPVRDAALAGCLGAAIIHGVGLSVYSATHCGRTEPIRPKHLLTGVATSAVLGGILGGALLTVGGAHVHASPIPLLAAGALGTAIIATAAAVVSLAVHSAMDLRQRHQRHAEGHESLTDRLRDAV